MTTKRTTKSSDKPATAKRSATASKVVQSAPVGSVAALASKPVVVTAPAPAAAAAPASAKPVAAKAPAAPAKPEVQMVLTHDQIARKAYEIWLAKGRPYGSEQANWYEAISALKATAAKSR